MKLTVLNFPYQADSTGLFEQFSGRPWSVFFDSGQSGNEQGRYDIFTAEPTKLLVTRGNVTEIWEGGALRFSEDAPFTLPQQALDPVTEGLEGVKRIQQYIPDGDCYYARRFSVEARGDPWNAYRELRRRADDN